MSFLWAKYLRALESSPLITKVATVATLSGIGDVATQEIEARMLEKNGRKRNAYNVTRTLRMMTFGGLIAGPLNHYWYQALEVIVKSKGTVGNVQKIALDQIVFAPVILSCFFTSLTVMEGNSFSAGVDRVKENLIPALKVNYVFWPLAQVVNFTFVPLQHRVGYVSVILLFWNGILSYLDSRKYGFMSLAPPPDGGTN